MKTYDLGTRCGAPCVKTLELATRGRALCEEKKASGTRSSAPCSRWNTGGCTGCKKGCDLHRSCITDYYKKSRGPISGIQNDPMVKKWHLGSRGGDPIMKTKHLGTRASKKMQKEMASQ